MDKEVEVSILLWQFLEFLEFQNEKQNSFWVHPINQKRNISGFIDGLKNDSEKFYNYCRTNISTFYELLSLVEDIIKKLNTNFRRCIPAEERLLITIR